MHPQQVRGLARWDSILSLLDQHRQLLQTRLVDSLRSNRCLLCHQTGSPRGLCTGCLADLPWLDTTCDRCALPCEAPGVCNQCDPHFGPDRSEAVLAYAFPVDRLLLTLKHDCDPAIIRCLAELLVARIPPEQRPDLILPVPLSARRQRQRGYNQAQLLADPVGRLLGVPVGRMLARTRETRAQKTLHADQRRHNLAAAFRWQGPPLNGETVAVIDDVMTTGATMAALSDVLKDAGAGQVFAWVVARTLPG